MINTTDAYESNTASIPPPKNAMPLLTASGVRELRSEGRLQLAGVHSPFSNAWQVPSNASACLASSLQNRWESYLKQLWQCQEDFSETSVHQLRVATRRLMTHFALVGPAASTDKAAKKLKKLKRHLKVLGQLRDVQVQRAFVEQQTAKFPFLILLLECLKKRERRLSKDVERKVNCFKTAKLENWTLSLCRQLESWNNKSDEREMLATTAFRATTDAFVKTATCRQAIDPADSQTIHSTRVAFKKFRYMVEALSPNFTGLGKRELRRLGHYQRRMGGLQDLEILQSCVARFLEKNVGNEILFAPFVRYLTARHRRALKSCLAHADDLFQFWDSSAVGKETAGALSRAAA